MILDGDNLRLGLNNYLGFTHGARTENARRTAEVTPLLADAGLVVIVCLITPKKSDRVLASETIGGERFRLGYLDTPLEVFERRDPDGFYRQARFGNIPNFTGLEAAYEIPAI